MKEVLICLFVAVFFSSFARLCFVILVQGFLNNLEWLMRKTLCRRFDDLLGFYVFHLCPWTAETYSQQNGFINQIAKVILRLLVSKIEPVRLRHCSQELGPVRIRHSSHDFATLSSHSVDLAEWQAKMASIEIWILAPWRNAHKPHCHPVSHSADRAGWQAKMASIEF